MSDLSKNSTVPYFFPSPHHPQAERRGFFFGFSRVKNRSIRPSTILRSRPSCSGCFADSVLKILSLVSDTLRPATWEDFLRHGFDDPVICGLSGTRQRARRWPARGAREWWNWSLSVVVAGGWSATTEAVGRGSGGVDLDGVHLRVELLVDYLSLVLAPKGARLLEVIRHQRRGNIRQSLRSSPIRRPLFRPLILLMNFQRIFPLKLRFSLPSQGGAPSCAHVRANVLDGVRSFVHRSGRIGIIVESGLADFGECLAGGWIGRRGLTHVLHRF
jgi:hypothetical protein